MFIFKQNRLDILRFLSWERHRILTMQFKAS